MLRHIISVGLAMAACATFIPTKVNAASLTVTPIGTLQKQPNDSITFTFSFNPAPQNGVLQSLNFRYDNSELSFVPGQNIVDFITTSPTLSPTETIVQLSNTPNIVNLTFNVLQPQKDGKSDLFEAFATYVNQIPNSNAVVTATLIADGSFDVEPVSEPVPEPLTMFGTAIGLGYGAILKRKSSQMKKS